MQDTPPSNARIYARPEKKAPSPLILVLGVLFLLVVGFFSYRMFFHAAPATVKTPSIIMPVMPVSSLPGSQSLWQTNLNSLFRKV